MNLTTFAVDAPGTQEVANVLFGQNGITGSQLWTNVVPAVGLVITIGLFAFSYRVVRKLLGGASRGKAKI